jgi:hypothetical protein
VGFTLSSYPPSVLMLCRESYDVTHGLFWLPGVHCEFNDMSFNWDVDTLYFPYPSPCSTSYGLSLGHFLNRYDIFKDLKHLALCLPPRVPADGTCMKFLGAVQERARRIMKFGLELESLTLVFGDPYMVDFKQAPKLTDTPNVSTEALTQFENQPVDTPPPDYIFDIWDPQHSRWAAPSPKAARYLRDIDEARTFPQQQSWNRDAAAKALNFYLGSHLQEAGRLGMNGPLRKCPNFGSPKIIWKGADCGVEDDLEAL